MAIAPLKFKRLVSDVESNDYFYRAMHFSAKRGIAIACRLSVRLSVRPSVRPSVRLWRWW